MSPRWGYEHDAPMGLLICRPDGAGVRIIHCGLISARNSKALQWRQQKKTRLSARFRFFQSAGGRVKGLPLIIDIPTHLRHIFRQANHLLSVAKLIVVPHIEDRAFAVGRYDSGL